MHLEKNMVIRERERERERERKRERDSTLLADGVLSPTTFNSQKYLQQILDLGIMITQLNLVHAFKNLLPPDPHNFNFIIMQLSNKLPSPVHMCHTNLLGRSSE